MSTRCEISMIEARKQRLKVMIIEDEEDILTLYNDYLFSKGYDVIARYTGANNIKTGIEKQPADVYSTSTNRKESYISP